MTTLNPGPDVLAALPDLPRWVEARGLLLSRRGFVVDLGDGCQFVCGRKDRLVVPITIQISPLLEAYALKEAPGGSIVLQDVMLPAARYHLPDWEAEPATVYTVAEQRARSWRLPEWPTAPITADQLLAATHLPADLRGELVDACARSPVWSASIDGEPLAFAYAAQTTEKWFDVSVDTVESARGRGLGRAAAMGLIVDRLLHGLSPVWGVVQRNEPSHRMARRLGFEPVDRLWVLTRQA